jgi:hypothetical protein
MGIALRKFIGGNLDEYDGQNIIYNEYPYYNVRNKPPSIRQREKLISRKHRNIIVPVNSN